MMSQCDYAQCPGRDEPCMVLEAEGMLPVITIRIHQSCVPLVGLEKVQDGQAREN